MPLFSCGVNLILNWSKDCIFSSATGETEFKRTDTKLYVPVVTLSTQGNAKLYQQLKYGFRSKISCNKYQSHPKTYAQTFVMIHGKNVFNQPINSELKTYENINTCKKCYWSRRWLPNWLFVR